MAVEPEGIFAEIRAGLSRENISARFRAIRKNLSQIPRPTVLHYSILIITLALAALIRLLPLRWGAYISEFDPYTNYNYMRQITANGWQSWYSYTDFTAFYPFGRIVASSNYAGTGFTGTLIYQFLQSLGINISVYDTAVVAPVILGTFGVLVIYFFARDIWGKSAGLFAALFAAFSSSLISRTSLGFFRNEGVGIPTMILTFLFFMRAINPNRSLKGTIVYSMLSSMSLIYMAFSWGSFRFAAEVIGLFALALVLLKRYSPRLLLSYGITIGFFLFTGTELPLLGHTYLTESTTIALLAVMGLLIIMELTKLTSTTRGRLTVLGFSIAGVAASGLLVVFTGISPALRGKFLATLDPFVRNNIPLVASVAENRPSTWASLYLEIGSVILLGVFGFFFAFQRLRDSDVLLIIFGITGFYFAASLVRLTLILAPALATLAAISVVELGKPAMDIIQQAVIFPRRKLRFTSRVSREFSLGILLIILILVVPTFVNAVQSAYTPTTIASASLPVRGNFPDWLEALSWMNNNLPSTSVVFAWWDYGYWISVNTGLHTLADNGTGNLTQIQNIATGLLLNESMAVNLLRQYRVTQVAVFASYNYQATGSGLCTGQAANPNNPTSPQVPPPVCGYGDDSKWYWMVRIGNGTLINTNLGLANVTYRQVITNVQNGVSDYYRYLTINGHTDNGTRITSNFQGTQIPTSNTLLGLLIRDAYPNGGRITADTSDRGDPTHHGPYFFSRVFQSSNKYVLVYQVNYPQTAVLTARLNPSLIQKGGSTTINGTLTYSGGQPVSSTSVPVYLQYSSDKKNWNFIGKENVTSTGTFSYPNWNPPSSSSILYVRVWWEGDRTIMLNTALSANQPLTQT